MIPPSLPPSNSAPTLLTAQEGYEPIQQRPEAVFVPGLVQELLDALGTLGAPAQQAQQAQQGAKLDKQALLFCERSVEFLIDMLSQVRSAAGWEA